MIRVVRAAIARSTVRAADRQRDDANWAKAAALYEKALRLAPHRVDLVVQAGNCRKEAGEIDRAVAHYDNVVDPRHRSEALMQKADALSRSDWGPSDVSSGADGGGRYWLGSLDRTTHQPATDGGFGWEPHVAFTQIGWLKSSNRGRVEPLLSGVVAIRGRIVSSAPLKSVVLKLDNETVTEADPALVKRHGTDRWLHVVNIWVDCNRLPQRRATLSLIAIDARGAKRSANTSVTISHAAPPFDIDASDSFVPSPAADYDGDVSAEVLRRPAQIRSAARSLFPGRIDDVLAMRVDQLGDVSATLPAMGRLKTIFPGARLTALVSPALIDMIEASGIFDTVLGLGLTYDPLSEKRYLDEAEEARVRGLLKERRFDLAIDLCPGAETRPLLKMINARYLVGFSPRQFKYLDFGAEFTSRDPINRETIHSHAAMVSMLVEGLAVAMAQAQPTSPRLNDDTALLKTFGLAAGGYVAIHSGARHTINCWPLANFLALADRIVQKLGWKVVFFSDQEVASETASTLTGRRDILFLGKLPMDHLDAILASSRMMIGNDSGPKHLAAVRGVETVSIHVDRQNWREWGQDGQGLIISKRAPCCGCGLNNELMCGKGVACGASITVEEVFDAISDRLKTPLYGVSTPLRSLTC